MKEINKTSVLGILGIIFVLFYAIISFLNVNDRSDGIFSKKQNKYELFLKLFDRLGYKIKKHYRKSLPGNDKFIIYFDYSDEDVKKLEELKIWVNDGGILFIAGLESDQDPIKDYKIHKGEIGKINFSNSIARDVNEITLGTGKYFNDNSQINSLISSSAGSLLYRTNLGKGSVFVLSDSSILNNLNLQNDNIAVLINNILIPYFKYDINIIQKNLMLNQTGSPLSFLFSGNFIYISIQIILIGLVFAAWQGIRFGKPVPFNVFARRTLTEHIRAVGLLYRKSKSKNTVANINEDYFIYKIKALFGLSKKTSYRSIIDLISKKTGDESSEINKLLLDKGNVSESGLLHKENIREKIILKLTNKRTLK